MLKLYQYEDCYYCEKVRRKLAELDVPYEKIEVDYSFSKKPEIVIKANGGRVPVLDDDGHIVVESDYIIRYLELKFGQQKTDQT